MQDKENTLDSITDIDIPMKKINNNIKFNEVKKIFIILFPKGTQNFLRNKVFRICEIFNSTR